jgi:HAMP domain-containing protein
MKSSIASKLFLGFLVVIFLNVFFVVVVEKLTDLYTIARALGLQNDVKSTLLRVETLHVSQRTNFLIFQKLKRPESAANVAAIGATMAQHLDTALACLGRIRAADSTVARGRIAAASDSGSGEQLRFVARMVVPACRSYNRLFGEFAGVWSLPSGSARAMADSLQNAIAATSDSLVARLKLAERLLDDQTRVRLADVQQRIDAAKKTTMVILAGMSLFALVFGLLFSRAITTSLRRLRESAARIGKGEFAIDTSGYPSDEIGELAAAFQRMAQDLKVTEEELVRSKRLAAIGEIVASVNHEINNPLMIISGNAQFLELAMQDYPADVQRRVRAILEETERIARITRTLRQMKNPVVENYTSSGEQMINIDKSAQPHGDRDTRTP